MYEGTPTTIRLGTQQVSEYRRNGFLVLRRLFSKDELASLRDAYREDPSVNGQIYGMADAQGRAHPILIWSDLGDDAIGMIPRMEKMVLSAQDLLGEECYHWHSKLVVKTSESAARINWHQDYASWYDDGLLYPNLLTVGLAVEKATRANGCLQVVPGSHLMGRIDLDTFDVRLEQAKKTLGVEHVELAVGDAVFFHSNTLHGSDLNQTDQHRVVLFSSYNARSNPPLAKATGRNLLGHFMGIENKERAYRPIAMLDDGVLSRGEHKSAFSHTKFKEPIMGLGNDYYRAVAMDPT